MSDSAKTRHKNPEYHVLEHRGGRDYRLLTDDGSVKAPSRAEAIEAVQLEPENGTLFAVIPAKQLRILRHHAQQQIKHSFEPAVLPSEPKTLDDDSAA